MPEMYRDRSFLEVNALVHREYGNLKAGKGVAALGVIIIGIVGRVGVGSMEVSVDVVREMLSRRVAC